MTARSMTLISSLVLAAGATACACGPQGPAGMKPGELALPASSAATLWHMGKIEAENCRVQAG